MQSGAHSPSSVRRDLIPSNSIEWKESRSLASSSAHCDERSSKGKDDLPLGANLVNDGLVLGWDIGLQSQRESPGAVSDQVPNDRFRISLLFGPSIILLSWCRPSGEFCERRLIGPQLYVVPPGTACATRAETRTESFSVLVNACLWHRMTNREVSEVLPVEAAQHDVLIGTSVILLRHLSERLQKPSEALVDLIGGALVCRLGELLSESSGKSLPACRGLTTEQRRSVLEFMQRNLKHDIHVEDPAKQTGHSTAHFSELFTQTMGCSPFRFLKELRMRTAHDLLVNGGVSLRKAAQAVGYLNFEHFTEVFRSFWGRSPRVLVGQLRDSIHESPSSIRESPGKFSTEPCQP